MFKKSLIAQSVLLAMAMPVIAVAETTMKVELFNETAVYTKSGQTIGQATSVLDAGDKQSGGDLMKFENSAKIFLNGDIGEESSWHGEVKIIYDSEAVNDEDNGGVNYKGHESYSQNDFFRELYVDTKISDWYLRLGKQQVVWGTADGIKLLDIINPTDFREVNQNSPEDARIPVWMINAEKDFEAGNVQFIVAESRENRIPGLNRGGDQGQPFVMKGPDTISGQVNGFLNVAPALANVATSFNFAAFGGLFDVNDDGAGDPLASMLTGFGSLTVDGFASNLQQVNDADGSIAATGTFSGDESIRAGGSAGDIALPGGFMLNTIAQTPGAVGLPAANGNNNITNLVTANYQPASADSAFEYMPNATFATFNSFGGNGVIGSIDTQYVRDYDRDPNAGFRFKKTLDNGFSFSLNYFNHNDANPSVDVSWHDAGTGEKLSTVLATPGDFNGDGFADFADPNSLATAGIGTFNGQTITRDQVPNDMTATLPVTVLLRGSTGYYGAVDPTGGFGNTALNTNGNSAALRFTERENRVNSFGTSFDYATQAGDTPLVLRGEFLYDKGTDQPVIDKRLLAIGDFEGALTMREADMFKYVLGADITVMTNLLVSAQFIQFRNLDYVDQSRTCTTQTGITFDCSAYTADFSTMHMSNGFNAAEKNKEFYSLFLSKPIGEEQLGRWNNIFIYEENGGYWNRLDADYSVTDNFIVNAAWNNYWGDENTTFGQLKDSSSVQVGFKYIFDQY